MSYVCTQLSGNDCVAWEESTALSLADVRVLLPAIVLVLVLAFSFKLIRRFLFR